MYVTTITPDYTRGDEDYSPWVVGHEDGKMLNAEVLRGCWAEFSKDIPYEDYAHNLDIMDEFYEHLSKQGYITFFHYSSPFVVPVDKTMYDKMEEEE